MRHMPYCDYTINGMSRLLSALRHSELEEARRFSARPFFSEGLGGKLATTEDSLDVVSIWVSNEGSVVTRVILRPQPRSTIRDGADAKRRLEEASDLLDGTRGESEMNWRKWRERFNDAEVPVLDAE